jgi:hypothetical protein
MTEPAAVSLTSGESEEVRGEFEFSTSRFEIPL